MGSANIAALTDASAINMIFCSCLAFSWPRDKVSSFSSGIDRPQSFAA